MMNTTDETCPTRRRQRSSRDGNGQMQVWGTAPWWHIITMFRNSHLQFALCSTFHGTKRRKFSIYRIPSQAIIIRIFDRVLFMLRPAGVTSHANKPISSSFDYAKNIENTKGFGSGQNIQNLHFRSAEMFILTESMKISFSWSEYETEGEKLDGIAVRW